MMNNATSMMVMMEILTWSLWTTPQLIEAVRATYVSPGPSPFWRRELSFLFPVPFPLGKGWG